MLKRKNVSILLFMKNKKILKESQESSIKSAVMLLKNKVFDTQAVPKGHNPPMPIAELLIAKGKKAFLC